MVYPTQTIVKAILVASYAIQSIHLILLKLWNHILELHKKIKESDKIKFTLEFENYQIQV